MKKLIKQTLSACAALALLSGVSLAADPLLGGKSDALVVADKDLAKVKGTGPYAQYYAYYGALYGSYAQLYGSYGTYYNYLGYDGSSGSNYSTTYYSYAYQYAYLSYQSYYNAYVYAYNKS
jgi:hypothetical protein